MKFGREKADGAEPNGSHRSDIFRHCYCITHLGTQERLTSKGYYSLGWFGATCAPAQPLSYEVARSSPDTKNCPWNCTLERILVYLHQVIGTKPPSQRVRSPTVTGLSISPFRSCWSCFLTIGSICMTFRGLFDLTAPTALAYCCFALHLVV